LGSEATGVASLAERYAAALFELADERHVLDAVANDLRELRTMLQESQDLARLLQPGAVREDQPKAVR
jgi:F-type H+-transporting ATPase subunit delta